MLSEYAVLAIIAGYFGLLLLVSFITGKRNDGNKAFFLGNRKSPWYIVAFGMIGTSISGVTFISVPGMVTSIGFTYLQMCLGFIFGYMAVAFIFLPIYYKLRLTSIYEYLHRRFGNRSYKTGAWFFLISKITGAAARLFIVVSILHQIVFLKIGLPFQVTVALLIFLIWLYTFKSGIKTIIWTDSLQTLTLLAALVLIIVNVVRQLDWTTAEAVANIAASDMSRIFVFDDWNSTQNFWKQFLSGVFIVIVMTGLDQDMMQKNLSIKTLKESQKNMLTYGVCFFPVNLLFLSLGALLVFLAQAKGIAIPSAGDDLLPLFALNYLSPVVSVIFIIGIVAASFSSADSALTSLTTSFSVDIVGVNSMSRSKQNRTRMTVHILICIVFYFIIMAINSFGRDNSIIDTIYRLASYTYGPLLGMFCFGLLTKRNINDRFMPLIAIASPVIIAVIDYVSRNYGYKFGYELLMLNALITMAGMAIVSHQSNKSKAEIIERNKKWK